MTVFCTATLRTFFFAIHAGTKKLTKVLQAYFTLHKPKQTNLAFVSLSPCFRTWADPGILVMYLILFVEKNLGPLNSTTSSSSTWFIVRLSVLPLSQRSLLV